MNGAAKGERERALVIAHQTAALVVTAQAGKLKPLAHYLKPPKPKRAKDGAADLLAMAKRIKAKQDKRKG